MPGHKWTQKEKDRQSIKMSRVYKNWWTPKRKKVQSKRLFKFYKKHPEQKNILSKIGKIHSNKFWKGKSILNIEAKKRQGKKISQRKLEWWANISKKEKAHIIRKANLWHSNKTKVKLANKKILKAVRKRCSDPVYLKQQSRIHKRLWRDPLFRANAIARTHAWRDDRILNKQVRTRMSASAKKWCSDPVNLEKMSKIQKDLWKIPKFRKRFIKKLKRMRLAMRLFRTKINKTEQRFLDLCLSIKYKIKFVGDGALWVDKFNPDFVVPKTKKVIDIFGDYWHKGENPKIRIRAFKKFGYNLLIIWEGEINRFPEKVKLKVRKFMEGKP